MELYRNKQYDTKDGNVLVIRSQMGGVPGAQYCIADLIILSDGHYINKPVTLSPKDIKSLLGFNKATKINII